MFPKLKENFNVTENYESIPYINYGNIFNHLNETYWRQVDETTKLMENIDDCKINCNNKTS